MKHELKLWPQYFEQVFIGEKTFEVRKNDRDYGSGDTVILKEWCPEKNDYTGRKLSFDIGFVLLGGQHGLEENWCVFSLINPHQ